MKAMQAKYSALCSALDLIGEAVGRDITLRQLQTLSTAASAGTLGIDSAKLAEATGSSPAAVSRNIRVLGAHHYDRDRGAGMGMLVVELDPMDNRRRVIKATPECMELLSQVIETVRNR